MMGFNDLPLDIYYLAFPLDARRYKLFVGIVYLLEVAQTTLVTRDGFLWFGTGWGNYEKSDGRTFIWLSVPLLCGIGIHLHVWLQYTDKLLVSFMVQCFLAWRIYIFSKFKILLFIIPLVKPSLINLSVRVSLPLACAVTTHGRRGIERSTFSIGHIQYHGTRKRVQTNNSKYRVVVYIREKFVSYYSFYRYGWGVVRSAMY